MANSVRIRVGVDDNATKPIRNIHDAWKRLQVDGAKGLGLGLGAGAGLAAWSLAGRAIGGVTDALGDSVKAAIEEDVGIRRLTTSLEANVPAFDGNTEAIERRIAAGEKLGFSDNAQRDAMARAVAATHDAAKAQDLVGTAMDLARFKGIDLASATDALIKVEAGQYRGLKALGIELRDGATQTEAFAAVQAVAAGQADEFGKTTAGAMERANVAVGNLSEDLGRTLMPIVGELATALVEDVIPALRNTADFIGDVGQAARDAAGPVADFVDSFTPEAGFDWRDLLHPDNRPSSIDQLALDFAIASGIVKSFTYGTKEYIAAEREAAAAAETAGGSASAAAREINDLGLTAQATALYISRDLAASLDDLPREINIDINVRTRKAQDAVDLFGAPIDRGPQSAMTDSEFFAANKALDAADRAREEARRKAEQAADEARRRSEQASNEAERKAAERQRESERKAAEARKDGYDVAKRAAREYFDDLHDMNLKAIDDARDLANAQIDEVERSIRSTLTAEQKRIAGMRDAEQEAGLRADVSEAQTALGKAKPGDVASATADLTSAQKGLERFLQDRRLDFLGDRADEQIANLDAAKDRNNARADTATGKENARNEAQVARFDRLIEAMEKAKQPIVLTLDGKVIAQYVADYLAGRSSVVAPRKVSTGSVR